MCWARSAATISASARSSRSRTSTSWRMARRRSPMSVPPVSRVSTAPRASASRAACVDLPHPSAPSSTTYTASALAGGGLLGRRATLLRRRAAAALAGGGSAAFRHDLLAADGQQLEGPLGQHVLDPVTLADRCVGLAVGD